MAKIKFLFLVIDGYSASSRGRNVKDILKERLTYFYSKGFLYRKDLLQSDFYYFDSKFSSSKKRKISKIIKKYNSKDCRMCVISKSFGSKVAISILNDIKLKFDKTYLLTIDPNWPIFLDWNPNLNDRALLLRNINLTHCTNIQLIGDKRQQCGARVFSIYRNSLSNLKIKNKKYDHFSIIESLSVRNSIDNYLYKMFDT